MTQPNFIGHGGAGDHYPMKTRVSDPAYTATLTDEQISSIPEVVELAETIGLDTVFGLGLDITIEQAMRSAVMLYRDAWRKP